MNISITISKRWALVILLTILVMGGAVFVNAQEGDSNLIHACVNNSSGTIKIVSPNDECANNEIALDWLPAGTGGSPGVLGYEIVSNSEFYNGGANEATVLCPPGKKVLGGGFVDDYDGSINSSVSHTRSYPLDDNAWQARFYVSASAGTTGIVYAICASASP